tara:strand:+ start:286 stop:669 length:384 start_codon:yes stop_codon:yes gene_type:complete
MYTRGQNKTKNNGIWGEKRSGFKSDRRTARVRSSSRTTFHRGEAKKKKHVNDLCQISSKKTNHLHHHVETKRGDVRRKSARQQQQNENVETGNDRAEERDGCVFFYLFTLLSSTLSSRDRVEGKSIV